jgi:hypothetical protein
MELFHVSPIDNKDSILKDGLVIGSSNTSSYDDLENIHLTSDYMDLIQSGVYPEILYQSQTIVVFKIGNIDESILENDPEFDEEDFCFIYPEDISPNNLSVECILVHSGWKGTTPLFNKL